MRSRSCQPDSQELAAWQFAVGDGAEVQTEFTPSHFSLGADVGHDGEASEGTAPHWLFTASWATAVVQDTAADGAGDDWTISTASMVREIYSSAEGNSHDSSTIAEACSDPLVCTAQELIAAAAASATPGVHAPLADSAALLNSGAVLLLGQGSTTICGTNTAPIVDAVDVSSILQPDSSRLQGVLRASQHSMQEPLAVQDSQQQHARPAGNRPGRRRTGSRRRQGLLVDSQAGLQQLVSATVAMPQHTPMQAPVQQDKAAGQQQCMLQEQQPPVLGHALRAAVLSGLQDNPARPLAAADGCQSVPASGDVLVLGVSCADAGPGAAPAELGPIAAAAPPVAQAAAEQGAPGPAACTGGEQQTAATPQPVLQLLSCSSLNSNPAAGRSNSSLFHWNLSNCSFLRLGSFTTSFTGTHTSSFSSHESSFTQSRQGSFAGQHAGAAAAGGALQSPGSAAGAGAPAAGIASRPSPLPMLHESCSWGKHLDAAERQAAQQHPAHTRRQQGLAAVNSQQQQQQPMKRQQQLIYLLD